MTRRFRRAFRPRGGDVIVARRLGRLDLDELLREAQELGRRLADMLLGMERPHSETRAEAVTRLQKQHADRKARERQQARTDAFDDDPVATYHYRPRM